jgi:hypothetical protein
MANKIGVGDRVQCRFYNTPDGEFYGKYMVGDILEINENHFQYMSDRRGFLVKINGRPSPVWLLRKEIRRRW